MYSTLLSIHDLLRWLVLFTGLAAAAVAIRAASGAVRRPSALPPLLFTIFYDVQVLVGALLFFRFSPLTTMALHQLDRAMGNDVLRFWTIEHPVGMIVGLALAHIGRARLAKTVNNPLAARRAAVYLTLAFLVAAISTPWPFMPYGRPLF